MRRYLKLAVVVAPVVAVALSATPAFAAGHVLTVGKAGGTAVKTNAVLKAGLVKGTSAVFSLGSEKLTCKTASFSAKVTANPAKGGTATESVTAQSFGKCTVNVSGVTVKSIKVSNLPFKASVKDSSGDPVKVSGSSGSKPIMITVTVEFAGNPITCAVKAASVGGHASNTGNKITFTKQKFANATTGNPLCGSGVLTLAFGPVTDSSVHGNPAVFVN